jgi:ketosteroid isomerase-like protein
MPREIHEFFERYRGAFNALDGRAVAELYSEPSAIAQGGELTVWSTRAAVAENMAALCLVYQQRGFEGAEFEPVHFISQGVDYAFADLRWSIRWSGSDPWVFNTSYNLCRGAEGWKVALCTAYMEDTLFHANGAA